MEPDPSPPEHAAPSEEPLEVDPVAEAEPPPIAEREPLTAPRKREYPSLLRHYRRLLNLLLLVFLGVGAVGWTYRWYVLREVLLQFEGTAMPALAAAKVSPLLCETLLHDARSKRRIRAATLLGNSWGAPIPSRGAVVWNALLDALVDPDPKVEEAAWGSLFALEPPGAHREHGVSAWLVDLPVARCVDVLSRAKSPSVRKVFLEALDDVDADAYWTTARWALRSLNDPEAVNEILEDTRGILYGHPAGRPLRGREHMPECIEAGLENSNPRIRDRCRRLFVDYVYSGGPAEKLLDWIRTTRDISTTDRILHLVRVNSSLDWETPLKKRLAEEADFDAAVQLSVTLINMVGEERDEEFLRAGLENPDPKIREYFETLLTTPPVEEEPQVEPDNGR